MRPYSWAFVAENTATRQAKKRQLTSDLITKIATKITLMWNLSARYGGGDIILSLRFFIDHVHA